MSKHGSELTPSLSNPTSSASSVTPLTKLLPSSSDPTSLVTVHCDPSDDKSSVYSESETERDGLESSNNEDMSDFDSEKAQGVLMTGSLVFHYRIARC